MHRGSDGEQHAVERVLYTRENIWLKICFDFRDLADTARFYYSEDGGRWERIGEPLQLSYTLHHFMGCRIGLFNYATTQAGGYADFDYFHYDKGQ